MTDKMTLEKVERFKEENMPTFCRIAFSQKVTAENIGSRDFLVEIHFKEYIPVIALRSL